MSATGKSAHGSPVNVIVGSHGQVNRIDGQNNVHVQTSNGKKVVADIKKVFPNDTKAPTGGIDDMTKLPYVHEHGVLQNLATRYELNEIYTYTGNILIAVNPFQEMPHLYDTQMMEHYKGQPLERVRPHVYAIAEAAYRAMIDDGKRRSILVTGESGSGKTETTHRLMQYLAHLGGQSGVEGWTVEQQLIESNRVLEAFGNAKTVKSHNSSRFGKFVEIQFDKTVITGATVRTYLLERSRVCKISDPERNYHCFYLLCADPEEREKYKLGSPRSFHYLNQSNCIERDGVDEAKEYHATRRAMDVVGICKEEQEAIFRIVAAILHLGNIEFSKGKEIENSQLSVIKDDEKSRFHLNTAAELLKCDPKSLEDALIWHVLKTGMDETRKNLDPEAIRDALAKNLYSRLFDWIVGKINNSIGQDSKSKTTIGVLDITGFENTNYNSFEQFCINYASEKLQQHFIKHVFKMEEQDYKKEEITWDNIKFDDNQDVIDLIEKQQGGIIGQLNDTCLLPESTHETFAQTLYQAFTEHKRFAKPEFSTTNFTISHYAGKVKYMTDLFLVKNIHHEVTEHLDLLRASKCSFVSGLFPTHPEESLKNPKLLSSIGTHFKEQLRSLMKTLNSTEPFYIRCVKPNDDLKPAIFKNDIVHKQLRCAGILEAIEISRYPRKFTFDEFLHQFGVLAPKVLDGSYDGKAACQVVLNKMGLQDYQLGKTKAFLRSGQVAVLDARKAEVLRDAALTFQRQIHIYNDRKKIKSIYQAVKRLLVEWPAAIRIQMNFRCYYARKLYLTMKESAVLLQSRIRVMIARNKFRKQTIKVQDTVKIGVLTLKVESLKAALLSAKQYAEEAKKDHADAMGKVDQLQDTTRRLEEKLSNREAQIQVLRRQALNMSASGKCAHGMALEDNLKEPLPVSEENPQKSLNQKQLQENQDLLIMCITQVLGFSSDKPVAATIIYKCLLQWGSFEANRTNVFGRIIETIASAVEARENNEVLAYWLCNTSTLLELLQYTLKASGAASMTPQMQRSWSSLLGRMSQGLRASPQTAEISFLNGGMLSRFHDLQQQQVEAKYPALLFKQQLAAFLEKIYGLIRDNLKKEIFPILGLCIQAPQTYRACLVKGNSEANGYAQQEQTAHWTSIEKCLDKYLKTMKDNYVPPFLVGKIFAQMFSFINVLLFNSLLLRREFCSFSNGEYLEKLLAKLKEWCSSPAKEYYNVAPAWDELKHIRQAVKFLVLPQKDNKTFNQIRNDLCPVLSIRQLYRISILYWDPKFFAPNVSPEVISRMRVLMTKDSNNSVTSNSFLLNDDSSIPFFVDDHISKAMQHIDVSDEDSPIIP